MFYHPGLVALKAVVVVDKAVDVEAVAVMVVLVLVVFTEDVDVVNRATKQGKYFHIFLRLQLILDATGYFFFVKSL